MNKQNNTVQIEVFFTHAPYSSMGLQMNIFFSFSTPPTFCFFYVQKTPCGGVGPSV